MNPAAAICSSRLPSWYARYVSFGQVAANYLEAKDNPEKMRDFINSDCAKAYESTSQAADRNMIRAHRCPYPLGDVVISEPCIIVMTVDLHKRFQRYLVRAHSVSGSWLIDYGSVRTPSELPTLRAELEYKSPDGKKSYNVEAVFCDCQYNPEFVYEWSQDDNTVFPMTGKCRSGTLSYTKAKEKPDVSIVNITDNHFKDRLLDSINSGFDPESGEYNSEKSSWHLPDAIEEKYLSEMLAENPIEKTDNKGFTTREWIMLKKNNHYFDLEKYQCAARYVLSERLKEISIVPVHNQNQPEPEIPAGY